VSAAEPAKTTIGADGTVHIADLDVPLSVYLSPEAKTAVLNRFSHPLPMPKVPIASLMQPGPAIDQWRHDLDETVTRPTLERLKQIYPVTIEETKLAGVPVAVVTPRDGVGERNRKRVLINLHGGGFLIGGLMAGEAESIPMVGLGKMTVVTVDYRQAPEYRFPAATEDVVAVYTELLKTHSPQDIGIYGCSAGARLTTEVVASLIKTRKPLPGAIGVLCGSAGVVNGDAIYTGMALTGGRPPAPLPPDQSAVPSPYFAGVDPGDTDAYPVKSPALLARFPPTLVLTATRDFEMSSAVFTHSELIKAGVDAELHVWDGLGHGFFGEFPELPESIEAQNVIVRFFDRHLGAS
jgi:acetyl esterase/lipase